MATAAQVYVLSFLIYAVVVFGDLLYPTMLQNMVPGGIRARATAIRFAIGPVSFALVPPLVGWISDQNPGRTDSLVWAATGVSVPCLLAASYAYRVCERSYARTVADAARIDGETSAPAPQESLTS